MLLSVLANMAYVTALEQDVLRAHSRPCTDSHVGMGTYVHLHIETDAAAIICLICAMLFAA